MKNGVVGNLVSLLISENYILCNSENQAEVVEAIDKIGSNIFVVIDDVKQKTFISLRKEAFSWYKGDILALTRNPHNIWIAVR